MTKLKNKMLIERCNAYRDHLKDVFNFLKLNSLILTNCGDVPTSCEVNLNTLHTAAKVKKKTYWRVSIEPNWVIPIDGDEVCGRPGSAKLIIGGHIGVNDSLLIDQSLAVCLLFTPSNDIAESSYFERLETGQSAVIRRFHFDYDQTLTANDRPYSHLQYGGTFGTGFVNKGKGEVCYRLYPSIEQPRIPFPPYDLVLTFDLFIRQFNTSISQIAQDAKWRRLVIKSEELWLKEYYKVLGDFLNATRQSHTLYDRLCQPIY